MISRKGLADEFDAQDEIVRSANEHKGDMLKRYRAQLAEQGYDKDAIKSEVEGFKAALKRRRAIKNKGSEAVEHLSAIADEIYLEITAPSRTRVTRERLLSEINALGTYDEETGEVHDDPATEPQVAPQPASARKSEGSAPSQITVGDKDWGSVPVGGPVTHSPETAERGAGPETAPASDGGAVSSAVSSSTHRSMSISPLEAREAGGLKGFGFTVSFEDKAKDASALVINLDDEAEKARQKAERLRADPSQADPFCLKPALCGQYSRIRVCDTCKAAAGLPTSGDAA